MFAIHGLIQILLHLGPNVLGLSASVYEQRHPHAFDKEKAVISRFLRRGESPHKAFSRDRHSDARPHLPTRPIR